MTRTLAMHPRLILAITVLASAFGASLGGSTPPPDPVVPPPTLSPGPAPATPPATLPNLVRWTALPASEDPSATSGVLLWSLPAGTTASPESSVNLVAWEPLATPRASTGKPEALRVEHGARPTLLLRVKAD